MICLKSFNVYLSPFDARATLVGALLALPMVTPAWATTIGFIVEGPSAKLQVERTGGVVDQELTALGAVSAHLEPKVAQALRAAGLRVYEDHEVHTSSLNLLAYPSPIPVESGASALHAKGIYGTGVTIAFVDTGLWRMGATQYGANGSNRILAQYDATVPDTSNPSLPAAQRYAADIGDSAGHGTHVTSIATSSWQTPLGNSVNNVAKGTYEGVAPGANIVAVRAFAKDGSGSYASVMNAIDWVIRNQAAYNIRVLNLSFAADPQSWYWDDPINRAVMRAWQAGIVVVTAAGNRGPNPMTVGVPGNVPYVITVGAYTDAFTPKVNSDDHLANFSSAGPTYEGFVKPDVIALGGHVVGEMQPTTYLYQTYWMNALVTLDVAHFMMSGTSQSAAVISGVVALMLQSDPTLTPNDVKCRLISSAVPAQDSSGNFLYTVFQQGAGAVNAVAAVNSTVRRCANVGLDVAADLSGIAHFGGPANMDANGNYYVTTNINQGTVWNGTSFVITQGGVWVPPPKPKTAGYMGDALTWSSDGPWWGALLPSQFTWSGDPTVLTSGQVSAHPIWVPQQ